MLENVWVSGGVQNCQYMEYNFVNIASNGTAFVMQRYLVECTLINMVVL